MSFSGTLTPQQKINLASMAGGNGYETFIELFKEEIREIVGDHFATTVPGTPEAAASQAGVRLVILLYQRIVRAMNLHITELKNETVTRLVEQEKKQMKPEDFYDFAIAPDYEQGGTRAVSLRDIVRNQIQGREQ